MSANTSSRRCIGFYLSYDDANCEYLSGEQIDERLDAGSDVVSATFVTPYPPEFPVLVPGQVVSRQVLEFIRNLDTREIHGYLPNFGYRVYTEKAIEMAGESAGSTPNGHRHAVRTAAPAPQKASKKSGRATVGLTATRTLPRSVTKSWSASSSPATRCRPTRAPTITTRDR